MKHEFHLEVFMMSCLYSNKLSRHSVDSPSYLALAPPPSRFLMTFARSMPLYLTLAWIYSVAMIVKAIVAEKEARLKETVRIMGLRSAIYWLSWAVSCTTLLAISSVLVSLVLKVIRR